MDEPINRNGPWPAIEDAHALIEGMKSAKPYCDSCEKVSYQTVLESTLSREGGVAPSEVPAAFNKLREEGWEHMSDHAGLARRCAACAVGRLFPWAEKLDAERVLAHMKTKNGAWELSELEALI